MEEYLYLYSSSLPESLLLLKLFKFKKESCLSVDSPETRSYLISLRLKDSQGNPLDFRKSKVPCLILKKGKGFVVVSRKVLVNFILKRKGSS